MNKLLYKENLDENKLLKSDKSMFYMGILKKYLSHTIYAIILYNLILFIFLYVNANYLISEKVSLINLTINTLIFQIILQLFLVPIYIFIIYFIIYILWRRFMPNRPIEVYS